MLMSAGQQHYSARGSTLVEILAALAIAAIAGLAIMTAMINSIAGRRTDVQQVQTIRQQADSDELAAMRERAAWYTVAS